MKTLFTALFLSLSTMVNAQIAGNCGETKEVIKFLQDNYKERTVWIGKSEQGLNFAILGNPTDKSWTMIQFNDTVACLVLVGTEYISIPPLGSKSRIKVTTPE